MYRKLAIIGIFVAGLMLAAPMGMAQTSQFGSTSGDARYFQDGQKCHDAVAGTDTTCVVLYGHLFDILNKIPINVQRPPDFGKDLHQGFSGTPGYEPLWDNNQLPMESSPGFVEYDPATPDKDPRLHPERGLSSDVDISTDVDILGYWYLSADFDEFSPLGIDDVPPGSGDDNSIGAMPCLTVRMFLQTGRFAYQDGEILAEGTTTKTIVTAKQLDGNGNPGIPDTPCPASTGTVAIDDVIEFEVNMGPASGKIPQDKGFMVLVEWWQHAPGSPEKPDKVYQHQWNVRTGPDYPARVVLPIENPIRIEKVRPQFFDGKIYIQGVLNSPWGSYDVDPGTIQVEVFDEDGKAVNAKSIDAPILRYSVDHDGHFKPVNATFAWDYQKDGLAPGTYTVKMTAKNWQWTGEAEKSGTIKIAEDITKSAATDSDGNTFEGDPTQVSKAEEGPGVTVTSLLLVGIALIGAARLRRRG